MESSGLPAQRRPWIWIVVIAVFALAAEAAVYANMRSRMGDNEAQFRGAQRLRLQHAEQNLDHFFGDADQLARIGARTSASAFGNLPLTESLVGDLFRSRTRGDVYGLGVFFAPYAFDPRVQVVSIYNRSGRASASYETMLPDGVVLAIERGPLPSKAQDYTRQTWYRRAASNPHETRWAGPYTSAGTSYISTMRAVVRDGRVVGVFTVDILTSRFKELLRLGLANGDIAWIQSGVSGRWLLGTQPLPANAADNYIEASAPLTYTGAIVHISSDATALHYRNGQIEAGSLVLMFLVVGLAAVIAVFLSQRWEREQQTLALQVEQTRLEGEITVSKRIESELRKAAYTDSLTGLPNRAAYMESMRALLEQHQKRTHAVFLVDVDRFNVVNETMGHVAGDGLLRVLAARLLAGMPKGTLVARLGGDEFVIVASATEESIEGTASHILQLIGEPVLLSGQMLNMRASLGVAPLDETYHSPEEVLRDADIAMYQAKHQGRARFEIFDTTMRARVARESELENALRRGIDYGEFVAHYQPLVRIATGEIASFEALIRWQGPSERLSSASQFIPFAESRGLVAALDAIMLRNVCSQSTAIAAIFPGTSIAANISAAELASQTLPEYIEGLLKEYDVPPGRLKLEITETAMMTQAAESEATLDRLRALGIALILDDFGTGYSSLSHLQRLPIAGLKIDQSFIENLARDSHALEIVRSIVALAGSLGLDTTAEGVETEAQLVILGQLGVTFAQGFLFSKAVEISALGALQQQKMRWA